jgi:hypothetical protein
MDRRSNTGALLPALGRCCCCCAPPLRFGRRAAVGGLVAAAALAASPARAATGDYEAMLINCVDPRFTRLTSRYMAARGLEGNYSHFVIAGGPLGAVHSRFAGWHQTFWDNLSVTVDLHRIRRVVAVAHRDCGAAKLAFGGEALATPVGEMEVQAQSLHLFALEVRRRHPHLMVDGGVMDLAGEVERVL